MVTNSTHKADLKSWVEAANEPMCSFSIQNLPTVFLILMKI